VPTFIDPSSIFSGIQWPPACADGTHRSSASATASTGSSADSGIAFDQALDDSALRRYRHTHGRLGFCLSLRSLHPRARRVPSSQHWPEAQPYLLAHFTPLAPLSSGVDLQEPALT
jgi:hypothetical protein